MGNECSRCTRYGLKRAGCREAFCPNNASAGSVTLGSLVPTKSPEEKVFEDFANEIIPAPAKASEESVQRREWVFIGTHWDGSRAWPILEGPQLHGIEAKMILRESSPGDLLLSAAEAEKVREALEFYAEAKHARFKCEITPSLVRTTKVEGVVETGWRARSALELLRKGRG